MQAIHLKGRHDAVGKDPGYDRTYEFFAPDGACLFTCDVHGECIKAPTRYLNAEATEAFRMSARRKLVNTTYDVDDPAGARLATLTRAGVGFRWKILGPDERELARVVDPTGWKEALVRDLMTAQPDGYAVLQDKEIIATLGNEPLPEAARLTPGNVVGRLLSKVAPLHLGLTLRLLESNSPAIDVRILVAAMTLVQVHDITGANRS